MTHQFQKAGSLSLTLLTQAADEISVSLNYISNVLHTRAHTHTHTHTHKHTYTHTHTYRLVDIAIGIMQVKRKKVTASKSMTTGQPTFSANKDLVKVVKIYIGCSSQKIIISNQVCLEIEQIGISFSV